MIPDLTNKRFVIFGLQGSGKTILAKHILSQEPAHFVFDTLHEYKGFNRYLPLQRDTRGIPELETLIEIAIIRSKAVRLFIIDEANRFCPSKIPLPQAVLNLNDFQRHYGIAFGAIARRPVQLFTDLTELAHYMFIFNLKGKNDCAYLDAIVLGLGDAVSQLQSYHFVVVSPGRSYEVHAPIDISALTKRE